MGEKPNPPSVIALTLWSHSDMSHSCYLLALDCWQWRSEALATSSSHSGCCLNTACKCQPKSFLLCSLLPSSAIKFHMGASGSVSEHDGMRSAIDAEREMQTPFLNLSSHSQQRQAIDCKCNFMPL